MKEVSLVSDRNAEPRWCFEWEKEVNGIYTAFFEDPMEVPVVRQFMNMKPRSDSSHFVGNEYFVG